MSSPKDDKRNTELIPGEDYPRTYREFVTMFPDNQSCADFLYKLRWDDSFICPKCGASSRTSSSHIPCYRKRCDIWV